MTPFQKSFSQARKQYGADGQFDFEGKQYNTSLAEDSPREQAIRQKASGDFNFGGATLSDPSLGNKSSDAFSNFQQNTSLAPQLGDTLQDNPDLGSKDLNPDTFSKITQQDVDAVKQDDLKPGKGGSDINATMSGLKSLADAVKPKEAPEATQYKSFTVDDTSAPVKDVMSARREALMKMMGGR